MVSQNCVDSLLGKKSKPNTPVTEYEMNRLSASRITVVGNYRELNNFIVGDIKGSGFLLVKQTETTLASTSVA